MILDPDLLRSILVSLHHEQFYAFDCGHSRFVPYNLDGRANHFLEAANTMSSDLPHKSNSITPHQIVIA